MEKIEEKWKKLRRNGKIEEELKKLRKNERN